MPSMLAVAETIWSSQARPRAIDLISAVRRSAFIGRARDLAVEERRSFRTAKTRCGILNVRPGTTGLRYSASAPVTTIQDEDFAATCCVGPQLIREQLQAPPHKRSEKFRPVPPIASTIQHIGESRLVTRPH